MAYVTHPAGFPEPRPGLLSRFFDAVFRSRQRHADQEIARLLERSGGRITDGIERQITENMFRTDWTSG